MINEKELNINCILADRIQLSASVSYITELLPDGTYNDNKDLESYVQSVMSIYLENKKQHNIIYDKVKRQYYIRVPKEFYIQDYPYISNVRLRLNNPYTVTFEFNFNRYIRSYAKNYVGFNSDYDKSIRIADDNYINKQLWLDWDNYLVRSIPNDIPTLSFQFSHFIMEMYVPDFDLDYKILSINQIEFSKDYFVGHHRSADVLHDLMYFLISSSGVEWINRLSGYAISVYNAEENDTEELRLYGDHYNPTLKFPVARGVFFKIYRKTTDHIRFELTYQKNFINKQKKHIDKPQDCRFYGFISVYNLLRNTAKEYIGKSNFNDILLRSVNNTYSDYFSVTDNLYNFIDKTYPELSSIADAVAHLNPISDPEIISFLVGNNRIRPYFERKYLGNGKKVYVYNQNKIPKKRIRRLKPAYKTNRGSGKSKFIWMKPLPKKITWINDKMYVEEWSFT